MAFTAADRFLVATEQVLDLVLVTADQRLVGLGDIKTLAQPLTIALLNPSSACSNACSDQSYGRSAPTMATP